MAFTLTDLRAIAATHGFVVTHSDSEYRIAPSLSLLATINRPKMSRDLLRMKQESVAYYAADLSDAVATLDAMRVAVEQTQRDAGVA